MVKNIVFDIGNVLARFQPKEFLREFFEDEEVVEILYKVYFTRWWNLYDQGYCSLEDMIDIGLEKLPQCEEKIRKMMMQWPAYVQPIQSSMQLIDDLQNQKYSLYILSNIPIDSYIYLKNHYDFIDKMDGGIYSYQDLLIKPDKRIYQLLLDRYALKADECLFIDDKLENIEAAHELGFHTILCENSQSLPERVKEELNEM